MRYIGCLFGRLFAYIRSMRLSQCLLVCLPVILKIFMTENAGPRPAFAPNKCINNLSQSSSAMNRMLSCGKTDCCYPLSTLKSLRVIFVDTQPQQPRSVPIFTIHPVDLLGPKDG